MADYVSGTDFLHYFVVGSETKGLLKVPLTSKLSPRDIGAGTQVEKGNRIRRSIGRDRGVGAGGLQEGTRWAQGWHGLGTWWINQGTAVMALETPLVNVATCLWR